MYHVLCLFVWINNSRHRRSIRNCVVRNRGDESALFYQIPGTVTHHDFTGAPVFALDLHKHSAVQRWEHSMATTSQNYCSNSSNGPEARSRWRPELATAPWSSGTELSQVTAGKALHRQQSTKSPSVKQGRWVAALQAMDYGAGSDEPVGPESSMARLAAERFRMCFDNSAFFRWTKAALMSTSLVWSLQKITLAVQLLSVSVAS
jgi:hypothetical protein